MKNARVLNIILVAVFALLVGVFSLVNFLKPDGHFSENENRILAQKPKVSSNSLFLGDLTGEYNTYFNDQFMGRDFFIRTRAACEKLIGKTEINSVFIAHNRLIEDIEPSDPERYRDNLTGMIGYCRKNKIDAGFALIPSACEIQRDRLPAFAVCFDQKGLIDEAYADTKGVLKNIDLYGALSDKKDGYIYYRTDHHWTNEGAYLAYREIAGALGLPVRDMGEYDVQTLSDDFYGSLFSKSGVYDIDPDTIEAPADSNVSEFIVVNGNKETEYGDMYFPEYLDQKDKYSYFTGTNEAYEKIVTKAGTGRKLLLFNDSYAHSLVPYLTRDYDEIDLIDMRYVNVPPDDLLDTRDYQDVLFLYSVDVFMNAKITSKLH